VIRAASAILVLGFAAGATGAVCTIEADGRFDLISRGAPADEARAGASTAAGIGDVALRGRLRGLSFGARAVRSGAVGGPLGQPTASLRWTRAAQTEVLAGLLRIHLGAGCLVADGDWDELDPTRAYTPRMLQAAATLSRSTPARTGTLARVALGRWRLAAWWVQGAGGGAVNAATPAGSPILDASAVALEGMTVGTRMLTLAAVRTGAPAGSWAWSATTSLGDRERSGLVLEIAGPLPALRPPAAGPDSTEAVWQAGHRRWDRKLGERIAAVGGRWRLSAGPLIGDLDGAFRLLAGLARAGTVSPDGAPGVSPAPERLGWRCSWHLPALAGVDPTIALHALQSAEGDDGPGAVERGARLELAARPWSGAALRLGLDARSEDLLRTAVSSEQTKDPVRSTSSGVDLEARLLLDEQTSCVLRFRQRGTSQTLDGERSPRQREIIEEAEITSQSASPMDSSADPAWLRERSGSVLWFRLIWSGAGTRRAGLGLAATPQGSSIAALVPTRRAPGGTSWRPLAAGAHLVEGWFGLHRGALTLEAAARWHVPAPGSPPEVTLSLGASWRGRIGAMDPGDRRASGR